MAIVSNLFKTKISMAGRPKSFQDRSSVRDIWRNAPDFNFYVRMTYNHRFAKEYRRVLIGSMKIFVPNKLAHLVVALDKEKEKDHEFGEEIKKEWPYPTICYVDRGDPQIYYGLGKVRMYWDMMYADTCTNSTYVGFLDTDTLFDTLVTPELLFEGGKPVIIAKIGEEVDGLRCWVTSTARFIGKKQVMNCMAAFPVVFRTSHLREMRETLSKQFGKSFDRIFHESCVEKHDCLSQFSMICNFLWYHKRSEYSWHLQIVPNGYWDGTKIFQGQVDPDYYRSEIKPNMTVPIPRSSLHLRFSIVNGMTYMYRYPNDDMINDIIQEGLCYSAGFEYCPDACRMWNRNSAQHYLFAFEFDNWVWDNRCIQKQLEHYNNVHEIVRHHFTNGLEIFGVSSLQDFCYLLKNWKF